jgi:hypothetical protein
MTQFRQISHDAIESASALCDRLMYGWRPPCRLDSVKDVLSEAAEKYSFVSDSRNGLSKAYVELLQRAACSAAGTDGLMTDNGS